MVFVVVVIWGEFLSTEVSVFCFFSHGLCIAAVHGIPTSGSPPLPPQGSAAGVEGREGRRVCLSFFVSFCPTGS